MIEWLKRNIQGDKYIWLIAIILSVIGLLAVYSATSLLAFQQKDGNTEFFLIKQPCGLLIKLIINIIQRLH